MKAGFAEAWVGSRRKAPSCPSCASDQLRYSRRQYEGLWADLFKVRPVKCLECGSYFAVDREATLRNPQSHELQVPFWTLEMEERAERGLAQAEPTNAEVTPARGGPRITCPACGSEEVRPARLTGDETILSRIDIKARYRCIDCNGSFDRVVPLRVVAALLLALLFLFALLSVASMVSGRKQAPPVPRIKKEQIPKPPPPVFR